MSGLYNMLFGRNLFAEVLMAMLNITPGDVGRYRDCYTNEDGTRICVFTRNGGGNRDDYQGTFDALAQHPLYERDYDDDYDCTYATIEFKVPPGLEEAVKHIADQSDTRPPMEKFSKLIQDLQENKSNATVSRALEVGHKIFGQLNSSQSGVVATPEGSVQVICPAAPPTSTTQPKDTNAKEEEKG